MGTGDAPPHKNKIGNHNIQANIVHTKHETTKLTKNTTELIFLAIYSWVWGLSLSIVNISTETLMETSKFSFASHCQLEIASCLGVGDQAHFPLRTGILHGLNLCSPCPCCHRLCESIYLSVLLCLEGSVSLVSLIPSGS